MLLDIMSLSSLWRTNDTMMVGAEDVVQSLSNVLLAVGGTESVFVSQTRLRLGELAVAKGSLVRPRLLAVDDEDCEEEALEPAFNLDFS